MSTPSSAAATGPAAENGAVDTAGLGAGAILMAGGPRAGGTETDPPAQCWGLGFQLCPNGGESGNIVGHTGLRGFFAAADVDAEVAVAATVSRLTANLVPTRAMLGLVAEEIGFRAGSMTGSK